MKFISTQIDPNWLSGRSVVNCRRKEPSKVLKITSASLFAMLILASGTVVHADDTDTSQIVSAYTQPSERAQLAFKNPGIVAKVYVKEGDTVKPGQLLVAEDDRVEQKQYQSLKLQGDSEVKPNAKKAELAVREHELIRVTDLFNNKHVSSQVEVEEAQLNRDDAKGEFLAAEEDREVKNLDAQAMAAQLDLMKIKATFDGQVEQIIAEVGELANPNSEKPAIVIVKNNPLWVIVNLPNRVADKLQPGSELEVRYADQDDPTFAEHQSWQKGQVNFLSPRGDGTQRLVRLTLANPENISSGRQVQVKLPGSLVGPTASAK
jgi:RND family efflux transporter MFP subunit